MKNLFYLVIFLFCGYIANAQLNSSLSFSGGAVEKESYGFMVNYTYNNNNSNYEIAVLHSMFNKSVNDDIDTKFSETTLNLGYLHTLIRSRDNSISINFGLGVFGGYQNIPENDDIVIVSESGATYGVYGVGQIDFYVSDNFGFILRGQENYHVNSSSGTFNPYLAFGMKFNF